MSWAVQMVGKPKALIALLPAEFDRVVCDEPEQSIKARARDIVLASLSEYPDDGAVKVAASGSQAREYREGYDQSKVINSLSIAIEPLWGFQE
jgi:hypothetical protein